jgi:hypothetical protein
MLRVDLLLLLLLSETLSVETIRSMKILQGTQRHVEGEVGKGTRREEEEDRREECTWNVAAVGEEVNSNKG